MSNLQQKQDDVLGAMSIKEFCTNYGISVTTAYEEIKAGRLRAVYAGRRRLVLRRDALAWERSLATSAA